MAELIARNGVVFPRPACDIQPCLHHINRAIMAEAGVVEQASPVSPQAQCSQDFDL
jgi:hypothetical protein